MEHGIRILGFETRYLPDPMNKKLFKEVDYVEISQVGNAKYQVTPLRIVDVQRDTSGAATGSDVGLLWQVIQPAYEAWKAGEAMPEGGTPLSSWNGITPGLTKILKTFDVRSVEDVAALSDTMLQKIGIPGLRTVRDAARAWEQASGTREIATALAQKDAEIDALREQMSALVEMVQNRDNSEEPVKRKPGRPRKEEAEEAA